MHTKFIHSLSLTALVLMLGSCFSTQSSDWDIEPQKKVVVETESEPTARPNVIIIMADDLGKAELSAYGANDISTPNIDKIGADGVVFNDAYVTSPVCAPSRAAILTGKYQQRYGFETQPMEYYPKSKIKYTLAKKAKRLGDWNVMTEPSYPSKDMLEHQGIPLSEVSLAEVYQNAGYETALIGKWHLGFGTEHLPINRGFNYHYGFLGAFTRYTPEEKTAGYHTFIQDDFSSKYQWKVGRSKNAKITENGVEVIENDYLTFAFANKANAFISKNKDTNFFMMLNFNAPHVPFQAPEEYYNQFAHIKDKNRRVYLAMIKALDDGIGSIMNHLDSLNLIENTIVYFISDNGGASYTKATTNGSLKGGKLTLFEGGINVPFMMQWKGTIPAGTTYNEAVSAMDIFPTSLKAAKIKQKNPTQLDGVDLLPFLKREVNGIPHETLYWRCDHVRAIRHKNWKMVLSSRDNWLHLYNLETDKGETIDLSEFNSQERQSLTEFFEAWNKNLPAKPLWPRIMDRKFIIGEKVYYFPA